MANIQLAENLLDHMTAQAQGNQRGGMLLAGDPGVGKTAFVNFFAKLLGLDIVVIEVPHITEEHIINIPFIVIDSATGREKTGTSQLNQKYELILSQSNLLTQIKGAAAEPDAAYLQRIQHATSDVKQVFQHFGGNDTTIPAEFQQIRKHYKVILFLDEFYRQTSLRIRNVLRSILNGRIGMHEIPSNAYIVYASNMKDQGLDEIPSNHDFHEMEMPTPTKKDWFGWLEAKFEKDEHVKLKPEIMKAFKKALADEHISYEDVNAEVRTSPRRWEQLLLYINSSLPVKDEKDAKSLLTNVKTNFSNYLTGKHSDLADKILDATSELIKQTSNMEVHKGAVHEPHQWRDTLTQQIEQKMKLGEHRKYIPVVSGDPGIGKAQPLDAHVRIPGGWKQMGNIKVGDIISTPDGNEVPVIGVFPQGQKQIYKLTFADGRTARACSEHLWKIRKSGRLGSLHGWEILTTEQIKSFIELTQVWAYVPLIKSGDTQACELPVDPYLLGCLLGDGGLTSGSINFSNVDQELLETVKSKLVEGYILKQKTATADFSIIPSIHTKIPGQGGFDRKGKFSNIYIKIITELGLRGKNSYTKFLPEIYKNASAEQKRELIAGLVDTDGYVSKSGSISISTSSTQLAHDIQEVVWSIGGIAKITSLIPTYIYRGERKEGARSYRVSIRYPEPKALSRLTRKLNRLSLDYQYKDLKLRVIDIQEDSVEEAQCILVDHPDNLYITDSYIVTHNTSAMAVVAHNLNLRLIDIDASELSSEDVSGIPLPGERSEKHMAVKFARPKLYEQIANKVQAADTDYIQRLKDKGTPEAKQVIVEYKGQKWKYLIFFDELNRTDEKTFNALRRVLLEKNFGPSGDAEESGPARNLTLPDGSIVVAAINPHGLGTTELTEHMRDVVDVIHAQPNWDHTVDFLKSMSFKDIDPKAKEMALKIIATFVKKFKTTQSSVEISQRPFHLDIGGDIYVSPREYSNMFSTLTMRVNRKLKELDKLTEEHQLVDFEKDLKNTIFVAMKDGLRFPIRKHNVDPTEFFHDLETWIQHSDELEIGKDITFKKAKTDEASSVFSKYVQGHNQQKMIEDMNVINYMNNAGISQVINEISELLHREMKDHKGVKKYILDKENAKWQLSGNKITKSGDKVSLLENFVLALLYALHANEYSNERLQAVWKGLNTAIRDLFKSVEDRKLVSEDEMTDMHTDAIVMKNDIHAAIKAL